jgi:hypothetical protein
MIVDVWVWTGEYEREETLRLGSKGESGTEEADQQRQAGWADEVVEAVCERESE